MTFGDLIVLCVIGGAAAAALFHIRKQKKEGKSCNGCSGCAGCSGGKGCRWHEDS